MRYVVVHGHFYQPPRENPWTERIDPEASAHPFPDWNERIHRECYAPNRAVRDLDGKGRIRDLADNYRHLSFNFGPTLLDWMIPTHPRTVQALREADREAAGRGGGGNAIAQAYNHPILPLLSPRDQRTQVRWGLAHFAHVFGRPPRGLWLPETAADPGTLEVLAGEGVAFTVLAPHQAGPVRSGPDVPWRPAREEELTGRPWRHATPSGDISLFFYDGKLAQAVAFGGLLGSGEELAAALLRSARSRPEEAPAVHLATDGETFGHHHRFSEMALARAFSILEEEEDLRVLDYAALLEAVPPRGDVKIEKAGSWSCPHGVERWRSDCGCTTGGEPGWNQAWRAPLREGLERLQAGIDEAFEAEGARQLSDPWAARDAYIEVLLDPSPERRRDFLSRHARPGHDAAVVWRLLEAERQTLLMFTSCGWFFADLDGLEGRQVLRYAARAEELALPFTGPGPGEDARRILAGARSNAPPHRTAADLLAPGVTGAIGPAAAAAEAVLLADGIPPGLVSPPPSVEVSLEFEDRGRGRAAVTDRRTGHLTRFHFTRPAEAGTIPTVGLVEEGKDPPEALSYSLFDLDAAVFDRRRREWDEVEGDGTDREAAAHLFRFRELLRRGGEDAFWEQVQERARGLRDALGGNVELLSGLTAPLTAALEEAGRRLAADGERAAAGLLALLDTAGILGLDPDLWVAQTSFWEARNHLSPETRRALAAPLGFVPDPGAGDAKEAAP